MRFFAYSFLRKLFTLYTASNTTMESMQGITGNSLKTLRCSVLETVRMYMDLTPVNVIDNFVNLAVQKAQIKEMDLDQKVCFTSHSTTKERREVILWQTLKNVEHNILSVLFVIVLNSCPLFLSMKRFL